MKLFKKDNKEFKDHTSEVATCFNKLLDLLEDPSFDNYQLSGEIFDTFVEMYCFKYIQWNFGNYEKEELKKWLLQNFDRVYERAEFVKKGSELQGFKIIRKEGELKC